jgi:opacity protein-like surface antigen
MRTNRRSIGIVLAALAAAAATAANAADMPQSLFAPAPTPYEFGSGWYLRGDIGYKVYSPPSAHFDVAGYGTMSDTSLSSTGLAGFGVGYRVNDWFRTDVTSDYEWPGHFQGQLPCPVQCTGLAATGFSQEFADISAWSILFNSYVDLPLFTGALAGLTPYVGGGIGVAEMMTGNVHFINPDGSTGTWPGASQWSFAWSLTAGASYAITKSFLVDVNYRYVNLGDAVSGATLPQYGNQPIHYDNIHANELRVGLRYLIN